MRRIILTILIGMFCCMEFAGCSSAETNSDVMIYYASYRGEAFYTEGYDWKSTKPEKQVAYVLRKMTLPQDLSKGHTALIEGVEVEGYELQDNVVKLNMNEAYYEMKKPTKVLLQAALLRSLCQIEQVNEIAIGVSGKFDLDDEGNLLTFKKEDFLMEGEAAFYRAKRHDKLQENDVEEVEAIK